MFNNLARIKSSKHWIFTVFLLCLFLIVIQIENLKFSMFYTIIFCSTPDGKSLVLKPFSFRDHF